MKLLLMYIFVFSVVASLKPPEHTFIEQYDEIEDDDYPEHYNYSFTANYKTEINFERHSTTMSYLNQTLVQLLKKLPSTTFISNAYDDQPFFETKIIFIIIGVFILICSCIIYKLCRWIKLRRQQYSPRDHVGSNLGRRSELKAKIPVELYGTYQLFDEPGPSSSLEITPAQDTPISNEEDGEKSKEE